MRRVVARASVVLLVVAGCNDNELGIEVRRPNQPPETVLASGPPDSTTINGYHVEFFWSGTDYDGTIDHYDVILVDHPKAQSHIDGVPGDGDLTRVVVEVPASDDPRWLGTSSRDTILVTLADTLNRPPWPRPDENDEDVRNSAFERWHTFFVRAVDNDGIVDPTPDYRSFNARSIAPVVRLRRPIVAGQDFQCPATVVFRWDGYDPIDESTSIEPEASRWVMISSHLDPGRPGTPYSSFPDSLRNLPSRYQWSPWQRWNAADSLGKYAVVSDLTHVGDFPGSGYYIFAVQARDEAGAITAVLDQKTPEKNNCVFVRVSGTLGPLLHMSDEFLGPLQFITGSRPVRFDIAGGQSIHFKWSADVEHYGGIVDGYRYGWDLRDLGDASEWSSWSLSTTAAPPRSFSSGTHRFYVQVRDNAGTVTQAICELAVHQVTRTRTVLWVDDSDYLADAVTEATDDARWIDVLSRVAATKGQRFDKSVDVFDVGLNRREPPPIWKLFEYQMIVWSARSDFRGQSGLRSLGRFIDPLPTRNQVAFKPFNYLKVYLANGGRLWINGFRPAWQIWPLERERLHEWDPVNVTNWDDPIDPHPPGIDSVGTTSLLYAMGIEMFDVGAITGSLRFLRDHFCRGMDPCADVAGDSVPLLIVAPTWSQSGTGGRPNVEIYNMPNAMATQRNPLVPLPGISVAVYCYANGYPERPGFTYPETADGQPTFILAKGSPLDPSYTRAFCGFEPYLLSEDSHLRLAEFVLVRHFGLGQRSP